MEKKQKSKSFIESTIVLVLANAIVKVIGACFSIPLTNLIGGDGNGIFTVAYYIYTAMYVIATAGLPVALSKTVAEWYASKGFAQQERYTGRMLGMALLAGRWACEWGLLDYDMDALEAWVMDALVPYNREMNRTFRMDDMATFGDFLDTLVKSTLVVLHERRHADEPDPESEVMPDRYVRVRPKGDLKAWYCVETEKLRVASTALTEWCRSKNVSARLMVDALRGMGAEVKETKACLSAYVSIYPSARVRVYELEGETLKMLGYGAPEEEEAE